MTGTSVLVNLYHLSPKENGGVRHIVHDICTLLTQSAAHSHIELVFAVGWQFANEFPEWLGVDTPTVIPVMPGQGPARLFKSWVPDVLVSPLLGTDPFDSNWGYFHKNHIALMCDALVLDKPALFSEAERIHRQRTYAVLNEASTVVTLSTHSRLRLIHHLHINPHKIVVIPPSLKLQKKESEESIIPKPFLFYPANDWPHKRHDLALQTMIEIWKEHPQMRLVLSGNHGRTLLLYLESLGLSNDERILDLEFVSSETIAALYEQAEALFFPSSYEGFGIPLIEAMSLGCPVVTANTTSIPEVVGDAALLVSSDDPRVWAETILHRLPLERDRLVKLGKHRCEQFSTDKIHHLWCHLFRRVGLDLFPSENEPQPTRVPSLSSTVLVGELLQWASSYSSLNLQLLEKEANIQNANQTLTKILADLQAKTSELEMVTHQLNRPIGLREELGRVKNALLRKICSYTGT